MHTFQRVYYTKIAPRRQEQGAAEINVCVIYMAFFSFSSSIFENLW